MPTQPLYFRINLYIIRKFCSLALRSEDTSSSLSDIPIVAYYNNSKSRHHFSNKTKASKFGSVVLGI